jgi:hypothetical protein
MKLINKESAFILGTEPGFFTTPAPDELPDRYFKLAEAIETLIKELEPITLELGDELTPLQYASLTAGYAKFDAAVTKAKPATKRKTTTKRGTK